MQHNTHSHPIGSRDRRKRALKANVRKQAFRLFARQGYAKTSVEQIAAAADISYSTFFRHFATKDAIAADMRFDGIFIDALESQPRDEPLAEAIMTATASLRDALSPEDVTELREHYGVLMQIAELRAAAFANLDETAGIIANIIASRIDSVDNDLVTQAFAWSLVGSWIAAFHYWISHPESDLFMTLEKAMSSVLPQADSVAGTRQT